MAKSTKTSARRGKGSPDPNDFDTFRKWLAGRPLEWSISIAAREALRVLPLISGTKKFSAVVLPAFRATAIARFVAKYPNRVIGTDATLSAALSAANVVSKAVDAVHDAGSDEEAYAAVLAASDAANAAYQTLPASSDDAAYVISAASAAFVAGRTALDASIRFDVQRLHDDVLTADQLARDQLWSTLTTEVIEAWQRLVTQLDALSHHWHVWIDWYEHVVRGESHRQMSEAEDAAFTDIPGELPWDEGAEAVNTEIARRLQELRGSRVSEPAIHAPKSKAEAIARLAEIASPQPSVTDKGKLDAVPNQPFDLPTVDDDLSTLPLRQRNLITGILGDLPANAPKHLKDFLRSYDGELKARGAQPILGLLKDDADIIAAAVNAQRAEDEWLDPGMRKAFDRFAENHTLFVEHFPLDAEREAVYAETPLDEEQATGKKLIEPFEMVAKATEEAHKAGATTDDFMAVVDKMIEFARVLSTQPTIPNRRGISPFDEIKISPEDRIQVVTTKKRVVLGALGFFERTYNLIGSTVTIAGFAGIAEALRPAIEMLSRFLR